MRELLEIMDHASNPEEFLEHTKLEMFQDQVFCFTPKGDLIALPSGATPIDFAYAVHTEVGDTCVGAKVNGRMVPLRTVLANGDQVEIVGSKAQTPSPDWEKFVVTGKARARIRRFVRAREREQYVELGRNMLEKTFRQAGHDLTDKALEGGLPKLKAETVEDLYGRRRRGPPVRHGGRERRLSRRPGTQPLAQGGLHRPGPGQAATRPTDNASPHQGPDPGHGGALRRTLLPSAAGRPHRRHRDHRQGRHGPHHRLRHPADLRRDARTLGRPGLGGRRLGRALIWAGSTSWSPTSPAASATSPR